MYLLFGNMILFNFQYVEYWKTTYNMHPGLLHACCSGTSSYRKINEEGYLFFLPRSSFVRDQISKTRRWAWTLLLWIFLIFTILQSPNHTLCPEMIGLPIIYHLKGLKCLGSPRLHFQILSRECVDDEFCAVCCSFKLYSVKGSMLALIWRATACKGI